MSAEVVFRTCTLCEAGCGLSFEVEGGRVLSARPDFDDPFSKGHVCPEGIALPALHEALLESRVHSGRVAVKLTDEIRAGVVSLPHGWGHAAAAPWLRVAGAHPGVSANDWTDATVVESVVGQSVLNGVPVRLRPLATAASDPNGRPPPARSDFIPPPQ